MLVICIFSWCNISLFAQKVGLVMSGGGAPGIAHIGIIKALEENNIPIDYVTGTSIGAIIGGMYAMGMSAEEMIAVIKSDDFKRWTSGNMEPQNKYFYFTPTPTPGIINLRFALDKKTGIDLREVALPTYLIPPHEANLAFIPLCAQANALSVGNFDRLFVPFRCVASDIYKKEAVVFRYGDLGDAIRSSATFPFLYKPIEIDNRLLFDGGIYNNFPVDIMQADFHPDFMIGSVVAYNPPKPDKKDVMLQLQNMIIRPTDYTIPPKDGLLLNFDLKLFSTFDFSKVDELVKIGYDSTMAHMDEIRRRVARTVLKDIVNNRRLAFKSQFPPLNFERVEVQGVDSVEKLNVEHFFRNRPTVFTMDELKRGYFNLISDDKIAELIPHAIFNTTTGLFNLNLNIEKRNPVKISLGGNISSALANQGYIGITLNKNTQTNYLDIHIGKIYNALALGMRVELPSKQNSYMKLAFMAQKFDYQQGTGRPILFVTCAQQELYSKLSLGFPLGINGIVEGGAGYGLLADYYNSDKSDYSVGTVYGRIENNTLNHVLFPTQGHRYTSSLQLLVGSESLQSGDHPSINFSGNKAAWIQYRGKAEHYFQLTPAVTVGIYGELFYSTHQMSEYYTDGIFQAQAFTPTPYTRTVFNNAFRAYQFAAIGLKPIYNLSKQLHWRNELYWFVPYKQIQLTAGNSATYSTPLSSSQILGETSLVFNLKTLSAGLFINYSSAGNSKWNVGLNIGLLLFNTKFTEIN